MEMSSVFLCKSNSFPFQLLSTKTYLETEKNSNSEMFNSEQISNSVTPDKFGVKDELLFFLPDSLGSREGKRRDPGNKADQKIVETVCNRLALLAACF